jgi:threonylcarbamoyladenosine tRNA methylthiotransferase MtaB
LADLPGVDLVAGNQAKDQLWQTISGPAEVEDSAGFPADGSLTESLESNSLPGLSQSRTRALVKIQDGCDNACTYCIIRVARGPQHSRHPDQVLTDIQDRLAAGHKEIVLTGVHIGAYGRDHKLGKMGGDLWALVDRILTETDVPRLRLSSIEPWDLPEEAFGLWDDARLCRHLHLPLQSGCDATLRRMSRRYGTGEFSALLATARKTIPDLSVTTDVIVGFPGETEQEFAQSLAFVQKEGFARTHVFPYSLRPGTPAAKMEEQIAARVKSDRAKQMRQAAALCEMVHRQRFAGRSLDVLWESSRIRDDRHIWNGLTGNYLRVETENNSDLRNTITATWLTEATSRGMKGEVVTKTGSEALPHSR